MAQIVFRTASQLAQAIQRREFSAVEVLEAHLDHIARHNSTLNAIVTLDAESARQRANEADAALARGENWGPLHGVPVTIKDLFETAGLRTTAGFRPLAGYVPQRDATVVARLRAAGAIILGKTNLPPMAAGIQTDNPVFGRTNNPWDVTRTPGGSSGGSAAAVAAGLSPLDIGSDQGGSIRIPAHFCGVFGLKPSEHSVSSAGHIPPPPGLPRDLFRYLLSVGPLARSVEDLRLALSVIAGPDHRRGEVPPLAPAAMPQRPLRERRFAWMDDFGGVPVTAEARSALARLAGLLEQAGCRVERCSPPKFDFAQALLVQAELTGSMMFARSFSARLPRFLFRALSHAAPKRDPLARGYIQGASPTLLSYADALSYRDLYIYLLEQFLADWDAWLCPVTSILAFPHRKMNATEALRASLEVDGIKTPYNMATGAYTTVFSLTGSPVVVLPVAHSEEGLPIGVQVVGRRWRDMELLAVAEQLAEVTGPFQCPPGYSDDDRSDRGA